MKPKSIYHQAIYYRKRGYSYGMISQRLKLSKSTLSGWLKEIPYTPNKEVIKRMGEARMKTSAFKHNQKVENIKDMKNLAKKELDKITKRDLWLLGIGLYLGEGSKSSNEGIKIINSDPKIIKASIVWFKKICNLTTENFSISIHLYPDNDIKKVLNFWSKETGIPKKQFGKTQIDNRSNKSTQKKGKLPYGTAHLGIRARGQKKFGVELYRRIIGWIDTALNQINAGIV